MAAGKTIEIKMVATGGAQAAAEVRKVSDAMGDANARTGLAAGGRAAAKGLQDVAREAPKAAAGSANMGRAVLEGSRAFEDLQYGIRGVLNNIPGLVMALGGGAGIAGAASLAAVSLSILAPKLKEMFGNAEDSEALAKVEEQLTKLRDRAKELATEKAAAATGEWLKTLDAEEEAIELQNRNLRRQIDLLWARREAQEGRDTAARDAEIARIETDPNLDEATKIREIAKVKEIEEAARVQLKLDKLREDKDAAQLDAEDAASKLSRGQADERAIQAALYMAAEEQKLLDRRIKAADQAKASIAALKKEYATLNAPEIDTSNPMGPMVTDRRVNQERLDEISRQIAEAEAVMGRVTPSDRNRRPGELEGTIKTLREDLKKQREENEKLRPSAAEAASKATFAAEKEASVAPVLREEYDIRRGQRETVAEARAREAEERARRKQEADRSEARRKADAAAAERLAAEQSIGRDARGIIPKNASEKLRNAIEAAAQGLQDGDQGGEIDKLADMVGKLAAAARTNKKSTEAQRLKIQQLEQRIKDL